MLLDAVCNGNELFIIFSVALFNKKLFVISDLSVYSTDVYLSYASGNTTHKACSVALYLILYVQQKLIVPLCTDIIYSISELCKVFVCKT